MLKKFFKSSNIKVVAVEEEKEYDTFVDFLKGKYQEILGRIVAKKMSEHIYNTIRKIFFQKSEALFQLKNGASYRIMLVDDEPKLQEVDPEEIVAEIINKPEWTALQNSLRCKGLKINYANKISQDAIRRFSNGEIAVEKTKQVIIATKFWKETYLSIKSIWR